MRDVKELFEHCSDIIGPMDTHHMISSIRVDIHESEEMAQITCNTVPQHFRAGEALTPGADYFLAGAIHDFRDIKEKDGQWKLNYWDLNVKWAQGNSGIMPNFP